MNSREKRAMKRHARRTSIDAQMHQRRLDDIASGRSAIGITSPGEVTKPRRVWKSYGRTKVWIDEPIKPVNRYVPPMDQTTVYVVVIKDATSVARVPFRDAEAAKAYCIDKRDIVLRAYSLRGWEWEAYTRRKD